MGWTENDGLLLLILSINLSPVYLLLTLKGKFEYKKSKVHFFFSKGLGRFALKSWYFTFQCPFRLLIYGFLYFILFFFPMTVKLQPRNFNQFLTLFFTVSIFVCRVHRLEIYCWVKNDKKEQNRRTNTRARFIIRNWLTRFQRWALHTYIIG